MRGGRGIISTLDSYQKSDNFSEQFIFCIFQVFIIV